MSATAHIEFKFRSLLRRCFPREAAPLLGYDPYDAGALRLNATKTFAEARFAATQSPEEKCRDILILLQRGGYPTEEISELYFSNLALALQEKTPLETPGRLVIGIGPGRCGSSSLSRMLGSIEDSCCTHEGPPALNWEPLDEQLEFHLKRFEMLSEYFPVVADVSHWWLNAIGGVWNRFPEAKVVGLVRDPDSCAESFMRVQGFGRGSLNPWARGSGFWREGSWDATYPTYPVADFAKRDPDRVKHEQIARYVTEYNAEMARLAERFPDRVTLVRTETLSSREVQDQIYALAKRRGDNGVWKLNVKGVRDGKRNQIKI